MTKIFRAALALPVFAAAIAVSSCATTTTADQVAGGGSPDAKKFRTGSKLPELTPYYGPEIVKSIEAAKDRDAIGKMVDPPRPLNSN